MARPSNTAKLVITSIVISLIVLAVFVLIFISYIVPAYQITEEQIYSVLVKLFPVLIGLVLIQIGVMVGRRGEPDYSETIDKLAPNAYDSPLYTAPKDDPMARGRVDASVLSTGSAEEAKVIEKVIEKEVPVEVVKEVPVEVVKTVEVPVEIIREVQVPVEVIKEVTVEKEVPVEVVKEVVVEKQVPVEVVKEVPVDVVVEKEVPVEVIKEVPVEIIKTVEVPVEVEKEVEVEKAPAMLGFHDVLRMETDDAINGRYDLSIVALRERDGLTEDGIEAAFGEDTLVFGEDGWFYAILPLYSKEDAEWAARDLEPCSIASLGGRSIDGETLLQEASRA